MHGFTFSASHNTIYLESVGLNPVRNSQVWDFWCFNSVQGSEYGLNPSFFFILADCT